jgi:rod shape-determining protein MreC
MHSSSVRYLIGFILLAIALSVLHYTGVLSPVENRVVGGFGIIQRPFSFVARHVASAGRFIVSIDDIADDNQRLREENRQLIALNSSLEEVRRENDVLREQLDLTMRTDLHLDTALVIGRDASQVSREIVINKGGGDGVIQDAAVIISGGVLVGRVVEVTERHSKVLLITDGNSLVNALVQESRSSGIVRGQHGLGLRIDTIPQNEHIESGNTVITSGLGGVFPKGLIIGTIKEVTDSDNELFQEAIVQPLFHPRDLEIVYIVIE